MRMYLHLNSINVIPIAKYWAFLIENYVRQFVRQVALQNINTKRWEGRVKEFHSCSYVYYCTAKLN